MKTKNKIISFMTMLIMAITISIGFTSLNSTAKASKAEMFPNMTNWVMGRCDPIPYDCAEPVVVVIGN